MRNVLRKGRASLLTNPFLEDDLNKNWCIGRSHSLCNVFVHQFLINFLPLHTFVFEKVISEADLSAVNLFTWKLFIGWVTDVLLVWLNLFSFYLWFCFLLQFLIFFFIWVMFHPCCLFLKRQRMHMYKIQPLHCLFVLSNLQEACWPHSL